MLSTYADMLYARVCATYLFAAGVAFRRDVGTIPSSDFRAFKTKAKGNFLSRSIFPDFSICVVHDLETNLLVLKATTT